MKTPDIDIDEKIKSWYFKILVFFTPGPDIQTLLTALPPPESSHENIVLDIFFEILLTLAFFQIEHPQ